METKVKSTGCCGSEVVADNASLEVVELDTLLSGTSSGDSDGASAKRLKQLVKDRYSEAATDKAGCGCGCAETSYDPAFSFVEEDYSTQSGYEPDADLGLGCGIPTDVAGISTGDTVLDLGSGAGIDAFIARERTGPDGKVYGVDFTPEMLSKASENAAKLGYTNVEFLQGDIERLPLENSTVDVILSNCVINLVPHKKEAFSEMYRVLRPGGHFAVSDIVIQGTLPDRLRESAALYAGCVSGAIESGDYLALLVETGFVDVEIVKERKIEIADDILRSAASEEEVEEFRKSGGIQSVTIVGTRPAIQ